MSDSEFPKVDDLTTEEKVDRQASEEKVEQASEETVEQEATAETSGQQHTGDFPMPPATFDFFVLSLKMQAEMAMGMYNFGAEGETQKTDLRVARHSIDLLAMIEEKTRGNLSMDEKRLIENSLTELRFRYVQAVENKPKG